MPSKMLKELLKRLLKNRAYYDATTGKVVNCRKGSNAWNHEMRHVWQEKEYHLITLESFVFLVTLFSMLTIWALYKWVDSPLMMIPSAIIHLLLETDAMLYAWRKN